MKKKVIGVICITFCLLLPGFHFAAEKMNPPEKIVQIITDSKLGYGIKLLKEPINPVDQSNNLNTNDFYRPDKKVSYEVRQYKLKAEAKSYNIKAEEFYQADKFENARNMYKKVLEIDPGYFTVMTYIGQTYRMENNLDMAITWFKKARDANSIDYMPHWFLASSYVVKGMLDKALKEITIAQILNRNNPRIKMELEQIYRLKGLSTKDWTFTPQMKLTEKTKDGILISSNEAWLPYAIAKAVWLIEPGYKESKGVKEGTVSTSEEKECLYNLLVGLKRTGETINNAVFKALWMSFEKNMVDEFVIYEIFLVQDPSNAYYLPDNIIERLVNYVITIRGGLKI